jgi:hypothetical protein
MENATDEHCPGTTGRSAIHKLKYIGALQRWSNFEREVLKGYEKY